MDSSPKRVTRARLATKAAGPGVKTAKTAPAPAPAPGAATTTTKIVTAAARARTVPTSNFMSGTRSTAAKRKTRADEKDDELEQRESMAKRPRGGLHQDKEAKASASITARPVPADRPAIKTSRVVTAAPKAARGRPKKLASGDDRALTMTKAASSSAGATTASASAAAPNTATTTTTSTRPRMRVASGPALKKAVKFQDVDKENLEPTSKEPVGVSLRGRPARRGGAAGARVTTTTTTTQTNVAASSVSSETGSKKPLSPRKMQPNSIARDESDDELMGEKTPTKSMMKSPIKPPTAKKTSLWEMETDTCKTANAAAMFNQLEVKTVMLGSPIRPPNSPLGETLKSPAKRIGLIPLPGSALKSASTEQGSQAPSLMTSLLQSAAKRPQSPIKGLGLSGAQSAQVTESVSKVSMFQSPAKRAMPGFKAAGDLSIARPVATRPSEKLMQDSDMSEDVDRDVFTGPIKGLLFSGRSGGLTSQLDPFATEMEIVEEETEENDKEDEGEEEQDESEEKEGEEEEEVVPQEHEASEMMEAADEEPVTTNDDDGLNEPETGDPDETMDDESEDCAAQVSSELGSQETPRRANPVYELREKDQDPCHDMSMLSDSDDDTLTAGKMACTPTMVGPVIPRTLEIASCVSKSGRRASLGFTPLATQLGSWSAASPVKAPRFTRKARLAAVEADGQAVAEMHGAEDAVEEAAEEVAEEECPAMEDDLGKILMADDDMTLAQEANEMSLLDSQMAEEVATINPSRSFDDGTSDASQEYGDENQVPVEPPVVPMTPARPPMMRCFHTTTKIPLKPADEATPSPLKKRSFSASRSAPKRSVKASTSSVAGLGTLRRSARNLPAAVIQEEDATPPATPGGRGSTENAWLTAETPGRSPRKDVNPALLRGAIVFVDVHTSEGADASGIFVELLNQMGARCVKSWNWNPSHSAGGGVQSNKIGITHVVFKDGGKRTLEKVKEANGVVQCVGVSWVLDCERENEWLEESSYSIDTANVPRGGARRRKSMEPKALTTSRGNLAGSPSKSGRRESLGTPSTPTRRRQSTIWMHTPTEEEGKEMEAEEEEEDVEWSKLLLTPVPKTPAPEAIARFAAEIADDDEEDEEEDGDEDGNLEGDETISPLRNEMLMRTCPAKAKFRDLGSVLNKAQDDHVLVRLMAARRKSLQFAPKIGSPLAKMWR